MVGSWTPADQQNKDGPIKHDYTWILNGRFLHTKSTDQDPTPLVAIMGIEPKSKKLAWWGFFADGTAGPIYLIQSSDSRWVFEGDGDAGPDGNILRRLTVEKTGDASITSTMEDTIGNSTTAVTRKWIRHRD